jgi:phage shock protein PspC (stress-responsive transcriptional regulator)
MKNALTIHLATKTFRAETVAYDYLKSYLFHLSEKNRETATEFERLLATELANEINAEVEVVTLDMAQNAVSKVNAMQPKQSSASTQPHEQAQAHEQSYTRTDRRLLRNSKHRVFGGVCSGLGTYYRSNPVLFRILFVVLFFVTSGGFFLAYLIMWIALPKENVIRKHTIKNNRPITNDTVEPASEIIPVPEKNGTGGVLRKIVGVLFALIGISAVTVLVLAGVFFSNFHLGMPTILPSFWGESLPIYGLNTDMIATLVYSILTIIGIPFLLLLYVGFRWIFGQVSESRTVVLTLLGIWVVAIALTSTTGLRMAGELKDVYITRMDAQPIAMSDTIYLKVDETKLLSDTITSMQLNNIQVFKRDNKEVIKAKPRFSISRSTTPTVQLMQTHTARGNGTSQAEKNALLIEYNYIKRGDTLVFDPYFEVGEGKKWQSQQLELALELPENSIVFFDESLLHILTDMPNVPDVWVGDMVNQFWKVTENGIELVPQKISNIK